MPTVQQAHLVALATSTTGARTALLGADFTSGGHAVAVVTPPVQCSQYDRASGIWLGGFCGHSSLFAIVVEYGPNRTRHRAPFRKCDSANVVIAPLDCACTGRYTGASSFFLAACLLRTARSGQPPAGGQQRAGRTFLGRTPATADPPSSPAPTTWFNIMFKNVQIK